MLEPSLHPLSVRLLNAMGAGLRSLGLPLLPIRPKALKSRAVKLAGLDDFGEDDFEEGLRVLCRSAEEDARLSLVGRLGMREQITRNLVTRLRRIDARKHRREVFDRPLTPPLIVLGTWRSGTTLLHRLLCLGPAARGLAVWEVRSPIPGPGPDRRREEAASVVAQIRRSNPGIEAKHHVDAAQPEECMFLLDDSFRSFSFWVFFPVYGYLEWYLRQDLRSAYRAYREHLQLFQAEDPQRRLTLKAPAHTGCLEPLLEAVPEALIVQTHRNPVTAMNSANSLFSSFHEMVVSSLDIRRMGAANADAVSVLLERNLAARERLPEGRVYDVHYEELVAHPVETVQAIYRHFDLPFDMEFKERLEKWIKENPQHKYGRHVYSAEDFGTTDEELSAKFVGYRRRFLDGPAL